MRKQEGSAQNGVVIGAYSALHEFTQNFSTMDGAAQTIKANRFELNETHAVLTTSDGYNQEMIPLSTGEYNE